VILRAIILELSRLPATLRLFAFMDCAICCVGAPVRASFRTFIVFASMICLAKPQVSSSRQCSLFTTILRAFVPTTVFRSIRHYGSTSLALIRQAGMLLDAEPFRGLGLVVALWLCAFVFGAVRRACILKGSNGTEAFI